ncbi:unnamed protein product [Didymodactylos carnosus]|uniref:Uncharacterized protein n=1 Tax=Didymodactylos carnosus TaxID=1234261 RepID=A0A815HBQ8_9BILA|nr:unnamed protein product [Didymodactylos carnosus]CAF1352407.1 unnamed protein product [Didymodactylos carnosus]CAF3649681.1 unnamed protein product [Didymodactylos carnosus]CAF4223551.1 unnamed protein product [Didymodactylos carnosus]
MSISSYHYTKDRLLSIRDNNISRQVIEDVQTKMLDNLIDVKNIAKRIIRVDLLSTEKNDYYWTNATNDRFERLSLIRQLNEDFLDCDSMCIEQELNNSFRIDDNYIGEEDAKCDEVLRINSDNNHNTNIKKQFYENKWVSVMFV